MFGAHALSNLDALIQNKMKKLVTITSVVFLTLCANNSEAQKLKKFKADLGKKSVKGKEIRAPYTDVNSYFGYVSPDAKPDEEKDGKKYYYVYVWIPIAAPEIGVRMMSPAPSNVKAKSGDVVTADYEKNKSDNSKYFDTWIALEKAEGIITMQDATSKGATANWNRVEQNDDSSEMPKQPSGNSHNSLLRATSDINNPKKALTVGLYRITFTTFKTGEVMGSFLAQIGSPVKLPGIKMANKLEDLFK